MSGKARNRLKQDKQLNDPTTAHADDVLVSEERTPEVEGFVTRAPYQREGSRPYFDMEFLNYGDRDVDEDRGEVC